MAAQSTGPRHSTQKAVIVDSIRAIAQELRTTGRQLDADLGITGAQLDVLRALESKPAFSINELAERTFTHQSSVSIVVSRLADSGLVSRASSEKDGRRQAIALTPGGRAVLRRAPESSEERLLAALRGLSREDLRRLGACLEKLSATLSKQTDP